jgi:hypothetical protein
MKITKLLAVYIGVAVSASGVYAQSDLVSFTGLGRVYITNNNLTGNGVKNDTTSAKRATNGYTLFDLGINVSPSEMLKASVILRARNNFGGFYGDGSSLNIRQFRVEGVLGKVVKYQIGDIDLGNTPYTLYNFEEIYHDYESDIFKVKRDVVAYENFNFGNKWRLQGGEAKTTLRFNKGIDKLKINAFGTRIKKANFSTGQPDRLLYGGRLNVIQSKYFEIAGNYVGMSDVAGTVRDTLYQFNNSVMTADAKLNFEFDMFDVKAFGEFGNSSFNFKSPKGVKKPFSADDYFYDAGLGAAYKPGNFSIGIEGSYREVGAQFSSPSAQTRRTYDLYPGTVQPIVLNQYANNTINRPQTIMDRVSNTGLYNQSISPVLMPFLPEYNNITPYGAATPNRKGFTGKVIIKDKEKILQADLTTEMVKEVIGEGTAELRSFNGLRGGALLNLNKLLGFKKLIILSGGYRQEKTTRSGDLKVDLSSTLIDAGLTVEVFKSFDLIGGYKAIMAKGNEYIAYRDPYNGTIQSFYNYAVNKNEGIVGVGARYRFSNKSFFTMNYQYLAYKNKDFEGANYNLDELFFNYTLVF